MHNPGDKYCKKSFIIPSFHIWDQFDNYCMLQAVEDAGETVLSIFLSSDIRKKLFLNPERFTVH